MFTAGYQCCATWFLLKKTLAGGAARSTSLSLRGLWGTGNWASHPLSDGGTWWYDGNFIESCNRNWHLLARLCGWNFWTDLSVSFRRLHFAKNSGTILPPCMSCSMVSSLLSIAIRPNQAEVVMSSASPWLAWIAWVAWVFAPEWLWKNTAIEPWFAEVVSYYDSRCAAQVFDELGSRCTWVGFSEWQHFASRQKVETRPPVETKVRR